MTISSALMTRLWAASETIQKLLPQVLQETDMDILRGWEGAGATAYFSVFDDMILREKETFFFHGRNRRPPLDNVNAMLSFCVQPLGNDCASALESVGLDAYVGFLHRGKPGRTSLAQDLMEELRPCLADRFVLTLINNRVVAGDDFLQSESGAIQLTEQGRRKFLKVGRNGNRKSLPILFGGKIPGVWFPMQALLLARYLREDTDEYPPFLWK